MARRPRGGAAAGSLLSRRLHPAGFDRRHRVPEQGGRLRPPVQDRRRDADHNRRRSEASGRTHRPDRRPPHLGLGAHPSSACPRHRARRRPVARRVALDRLQARLLPAGARSVASLPPALPRRPRSPAQGWSPRLPRRPRPARRQHTPSTPRSRRCAAPSGSSTPRGRSPGRRPSSPISPATLIASRSRTPGSSRSTSKGVTFKWKDYRIKGRDRLKTMTLDAAEFIRRFLLHVLPSGFHRIRHMWTASWQVVFDALIALVGCGHMSGLLVRYRTAGPDDIRQSWSLSLRRARGSWRMSGCPGLSLRPCRSSRRCACQSLRN